MLDIEDAVSELVNAARNIKMSGKFSRETLSKTFDAVDQLNRASPEEIETAMSNLGGNADEMVTLLTGVLLARTQGEIESKKTGATQTFTSDDCAEGYLLSKY